MLRRSLNCRNTANSSDRTLKPTQALNSGYLASSAIIFRSFKDICYLAIPFKLEISISSFIVLVQCIHWVHQIRSAPSQAKMVSNYRAVWGKEPFYSMVAYFNHCSTYFDSSLRAWEKLWQRILCYKYSIKELAAFSNVG